MKQLTCEMCGSTELIKQEGFFVCQTCGTKYSVEEAKKMMIEGTVNVVGTVSIDNSASYDRILELARDAYNDKRFESAYNYYCQVVDIRQDVAENVLRQGLSILAKEAVQSSVPSSCTNRVTRAIDLIRQMSPCEEKNTAIFSAIEDLISACAESKNYLSEEINDLELQKMKTRSAGDILADLGRPAFVVSQNRAEDKKIERHNKAIDEKIAVVRTRSSKIDDFEKEYTEKLLDCADANAQFTYWYKKGTVAKIIALYPKITLTLDAQKKLTEEDNYMFWATKTDSLELIKVLVKMGCDVNKSTAEVSPLFMATAFAPTDEAQKQKCIEITKILLEHGAKVDPNEKNNDGRYLVNTDTPDEIKRLLIAKNPDVQHKIAEAPKKKSGCYVATCVYGSYDCPQVWTLRRYRDDTLGSTWYGRLFIHTYYAISPILVKWFGNTNWFKKLWKGKLDRMVAKLQNNGVEDTPYEDKEW